MGGQKVAVRDGTEATHHAAAGSCFSGRLLLRSGGDGIEISPRHGLQLIQFGGVQAGFF